MSTRWEGADRRIGLVLVAIVAVVLGAVGYLALDIVEPEELWYAEFDKLGGLAPQTPVLVEGYTIGRVTDVRPIVGDSGRLRFRATMRIPQQKDPIPLPIGTVALLVPPPVVGTATLTLVRPVSGGEQLPAGSTLEGQVAASIVDDLSEAVSALRVLAANSGAQVDRLSDSLAGVTSVARKELEAVTALVREVVTSADGLVATLDADARAVGGIVASASPIPARSLALIDSLTALTTALQTTVARVDSLVVSETPAIRRMTAQFDTTSAAVTHVLKRFARRPLRIFTGIDTTSFPPPAATPPTTMPPATIPPAGAPVTPARP